MEFKLVKNGWYYEAKRVLLIFFIPLLLCIPFFFAEKMDSDIFGVSLLVSFLMWQFFPNIIKPKIIGKIIFNENGLSITKNEEEKIINFSDMNYIKMGYSRHFNEYDIGLSYTLVDDGINNIYIKTKEERIQLYYFSKNGNEEYMIKDYLPVFDENKVLYKVTIKGENLLPSILPF
jgi:hypothetical protein